MILKAPDNIACINNAIYLILSVSTCTLLDLAELGTLYMRCRKAGLVGAL